jgi:hypothetical protein
MDTRARHASVATKTGGSPGTTIGSGVGLNISHASKAATAAAGTQRI